MISSLQQRLRLSTVSIHTLFTVSSMSTPDRSEVVPRVPDEESPGSFYHLRKTLVHQSSSTHSFDIKPNSYNASKFVIVIDTEKVLEAGFSGLNTRAGNLLTVKFQI